ncbi:MAG: hypothetical protein GC185_03590 [Alphaproteobacteria bacterium]|nr:hypothetical protein [Alphaproteobacteria bacterium]
MASASGESFNKAAANKVVRFSEMKRKLLELYEKELTLAEKIYLRTLDPISAFIAGVAYARAAVAGRLSDKAAVWRGRDNETYVNAARFLAQKSYEVKFAINKRICAKTWELGARAFDACEDYSGSLPLQGAKVIF